MSAQDPNETVKKHGYELTVYRGFCSRAEITESNTIQRELFEQSGRYDLPGGQKRPDGKHTVRFKGGAHGQDLTLVIDDPGLRVAGITIELYQQPYNETRGRTKNEPVETLRLENDPVVCPPNC